MYPDPNDTRVLRTNDPERHLYTIDEIVAFENHLDAYYSEIFDEQPSLQRTADLSELERDLWKGLDDCNRSVVEISNIRRITPPTPGNRAEYLGPAHIPPEFIEDPVTIRLEIEHARAGEDLKLFFHGLRYQAGNRYYADIREEFAVTSWDEVTDTMTIFEMVAERIRKDVKAYFRRKNVSKRDIGIEILNSYHESLASVARGILLQDFQRYFRKPFEAPN